nr:hypothetical protein Iba_chr11aCG9960 [Ipomoea batatas]
MSLLHSFLFLRKMPALILTEVRGQAAELRKEQVKEAKKKCYRCICSHLMIFTSTKTDCLSTKCTLGSSQLEFLHPSLISSDFRMFHPVSRARYLLLFRELHVNAVKSLVYISL